MQCYHCGEHIPGGRKACPACGRARTRLIYAPLWGAVAGVLASFAGYTLLGIPGAIAGGLLGVVAGEAAARWVFWPA